MSQYVLVASSLSGGFVVVIESLFIVSPIVHRGSVFCFVMQYLVSFPVFAFILMRKRELVT